MFEDDEEVSSSDNNDFFDDFYNADTDDYDDYIPRRRRKKKRSLPFGCRSRFAAGIALCIFICCLLFVILKWDSIAPASLVKKANFADSKKKEANTAITGTSVLEKNIQAVDTGIMYISDTSLVELNHDCERIFYEKHSFTNPLMKSSGNYTIAFNAGSGDYRIIYNKEKKHEGVEGSSITDCDINASGTYCIISDKTGYLSNLSVYNKDNEFVYSYSFSDFYAVSAAISPDGKQVTVGAVNSFEGRLMTKVYVLDVTKNEPLNVFSYDDNLVYDVKYLADDRVAVVTDALTTVISKNAEKEVPYTYSSMILTAYDFCEDSGIVLSLSKSADGRNCTVVSLDDEGHEIGLFTTDQKILSLYAAQDRTAILSYGKLSLYNAYGDKFGEWEIGSDSKSVLLPENKTAYILGVSGITKMTLDY